MRQLFIILVIFTFTVTTTTANPLIVRPFDEASKDPSFEKFRAKLLRAVMDQNIEAVISMTDSDIHLSFGGHTGHDDLRLFFKESSQNPDQNIWKELEKVLTLGGEFQDGIFMAPYTFAVQLPEQYDPFQTFFVTGSDVLLRKHPDKTSTPVNALSYAVVEVLEYDPDIPYQRITVSNTVKLTGLYIATQYLRSVVDYRAGFANHDGSWKMMSFIAGD